MMDPGGGTMTVDDTHTTSQPWHNSVRGLLCRRLLGNDYRSQLPRAPSYTADHVRVQPLRDGHHVLFTDPRSGNLCLAANATLRSLNGLSRKILFSSPATASPLPVLYAARTDMQHGVRVVATFSVKNGGATQLNHDEIGPEVLAPQTGLDKQMIVFYTVPPDMLYDISQDTSSSHSSMRAARMTGNTTAPEWAYWQEGTHDAEDRDGEAFVHEQVHPLQIQGQFVATCNNLVELALDPGPDMVIWAFSAEGWARAWALRTGRDDTFNHAAVQQDGSLRYVDPDGDLVMAELETATASTVDVMGSYPSDEPSTNADQFFHWTSAAVEGGNRFLSGLESGWEDGRVGVDLVVEERNGVTRMDVELR